MHVAFMLMQALPRGWPLLHRLQQDLCANLMNSVIAGRSDCGKGVRLMAGPGAWVKAFCSGGVAADSANAAAGKPKPDQHHQNRFDAHPLSRWIERRGQSAALQVEMAETVFPMGMRAVDSGVSACASGAWPVVRQGLMGLGVSSVSLCVVSMHRWPGRPSVEM